MANTEQCTGTEGVFTSDARTRGLIPPDWDLYGRAVCTRCGNFVLPRQDGRLQKHKAISKIAKFAR